MTFLLGMAITLIIFEAKNGHCQSEVFVCNQGTYANNLARLLIIVTINNIFNNLKVVAWYVTNKALSDCITITTSLIRNLPSTHLLSQW